MAKRRKLMAPDEAAPETPVDTAPEAPAPVAEAAPAAEEPSAREQADAEAAQAAQAILAANAAAIAAENAKPPEPEEEEEHLGSILEKGRDYLEQKMREHEAKKALEAEAYQPPLMTDRQREMLSEEQLAGQRALERHAERMRQHPPPNRSEPGEGTNSPVYRPSMIVPDPALPAGQFAAGSRGFGV